MSTTTDNEDEPRKQLITYAQVETEYELPRRHLYQLVHQERIPCIRFGPRFVRFRRCDLDQWIEKHRVGTRGAK